MKVKYIYAERCFLMRFLGMISPLVVKGEKDDWDPGTAGEEAGHC